MHLCKSLFNNWSLQLIAGEAIDDTGHAQLIRTRLIRNSTLFKISVTFL